MDMEDVESTRTTQRLEVMLLLQHLVWTMASWVDESTDTRVRLTLSLCGHDDIEE